MYYQDIDSSPSLSTAQKSLEALANASLVIVLIACLTFVVVLLYKFNCMRFFLGYCVLYSAALLGLAGSKIVLIVLSLDLNWVIDGVSLAFVMYNFAVVGVLGIFYQKGIPTFVERSYLVATSVIVAWQLAQLPEVRSMHCLIVFTAFTWIVCPLASGVSGCCCCCSASGTSSPC